MFSVAVYLLAEIQLYFRFRGWRQVLNFSYNGPHGGVTLPQQYRCSCNVVHCIVYVLSYTQWR